MFQVDSTYAGHEAHVANFWTNANIDELIRQVDLTNAEEFRFTDGPPFVSGSLHMGSLSISFIKDTVLRYQRMHGKRCTNKIGFDCHGLPSENMVMKLLNLNSKKEIEEYGVDKFIEKCIATIHEYSNSWKPTYDRIGRTVDFNNQYKTIDKNFMEIVWWIFKEIHRQNLVYKAFKVMPYSYACETPLSNFEAGLNYKQITTNSVYVKFQFKESPNTFFIIWTTTPWTLTSNVALIVSPTIMYVKCYTKIGEVYVLSENCQNNLKLEFDKVEQIGLGSTLKGIEYLPLFNYMNFTYQKVLVDNYVQDTPEIGTGIVHASASHGVDDCRVCLENNVIDSRDLHKTCLVDSTGKFIAGMGELSGKIVFDTNRTIIQMLKQSNMLVLTQNYMHQYPFCYRTDTPLLYKIVSSHFIAVSQIKDQLVAMNDKINWSNPEIGQKRFRNWIADAKDWCVSRNRYFGTPIPVWESDDGEESIVIGSIDELVQLAGLTERPQDLHLHTIGNITIISPTSEKVLHINRAMFDCWFESGVVPYGQHHYPFENANIFDNQDYLCDFVAEGLDQTRGWFYTLLVISTIISRKPPFKNVICTGLILDKTGQKLSKRNGNFVDPNILVDKYGADVIRLYLLSSQLINGEPLMFNEEEVHNVCKRLIPFLNVMKFYCEQKTIFKAELVSCKEQNLTIDYITTASNHQVQDITDMWILTKLANLKENVEQHMNLYHIDNAVCQLIDFIEDMSNWYIKISRDRFKGKDGIREQQLSLSVLYTVLYDYTLLIAPFAPFLSEHCYQYLTRDAYAKRKEYCIKALENEINILKYKVKFIKDYLNRTIKLEREDKDKVIDQLVTLEYPKLHYSIEAPEEKRTYDYITGMQLFSLTLQKMEELENEYGKKQDEYDNYNSIMVEELWKKIPSSFQQPLSFDAIQLNKSIHLCQYPKLQCKYPDTAFEELKKVVFALRRLRSGHKTHEALRTPIKKCTVYHPRAEYLTNLKAIIDIAYDEINCLEYEYKLMTNDMLVYVPKVNIKSLGQKFKKDANDIKKKIEGLTQIQLQQFATTNSITIDGNTFTLDDFELGLAINIKPSQNTIIISQDDLILEVDFTFDREVYELNQAKNLVFCVQRFRKELGLKPWDNIIIKHETTFSSDFLDKHVAYIAEKIDKPFLPYIGEVTDKQKVYKYTDLGNIEREIKIHLYILLD